MTADNGQIMIKPTIGLRVWYWPSAQDLEAYQTVGDGAVPTVLAPRMERFADSQPFDAGVVYVWGDRMVNLSVTDHGGTVHSRRSVTLVQEGDTPPETGRFATWMPYQIAAAKPTPIQPPVDNANVFPGCEQFGEKKTAT